MYGFIRLGKHGMNHSKSSSEGRLRINSPDVGGSESGTKAALEPSFLGRVLRARRLALGLTLDDLASRAGCAKSYLSMIESGRRETPPSDELLSRLEVQLRLDPGAMLAHAHWQNTPASIRRQLEALEGTRRAAVAQLRELLDRGLPRGGNETARAAPVPSMVLDELWRSGKLQGLVDRLGAVDGSAGEGNLRRMGGELSGVGMPVEVPLINSVAAGYPRDFTDKGYPARVADSYVRSPDIADPDAFACRVVGDSMTPDYREGDIVIFSPARDAKDGADCFVRLEPDHETTFKRIHYERRGGTRTDAPDGEAPVTHLRLQPLNASYPARMVAREEVAGLYPAVSVTRRLG